MAQGFLHNSLLQWCFHLSKNFLHLCIRYQQTPQQPPLQVARGHSGRSLHLVLVPSNSLVCVRPSPSTHSCTHHHCRNWILANLMYSCSMLLSHHLTVTIFRALHCIGWNFYFPSPVEQLQSLAHWLSRHSSSHRCIGVDRISN